MTRKKILFICGSINQTTQMHQIAAQLPEHEHFYSPYYGDLHVDFMRWLGGIEYTIGGRKLRARCAAYLHEHGLNIDDGGRLHDYDLVFHCSDLVWPSNITHRKVILVQEGMTDPPSVLFPIVKRLDFLPRWMAGTSATGLSHKYTRFCVASEGYKELFVSHGVDPAKIEVTGIPNFDDCKRYYDNDFPHKNYVLVCTSDVREVFWYEDRKGFIEKAKRIAAGRKLIFKLHPNEKLPRATDEIARWAPGSLVYTTGSAEQMVANCDVLVCQYSSLAHIGMALGKEVHSFFDIDELRKLKPLQHGMGAKNIAAVARRLLGEPEPVVAEPPPPPRPSTRSFVQEQPRP
ncbi:MAG: hypothetical protein U0359_12650 [Byssovorax sp.]